MELLQLGKTPIKPDAPAGEDAKYEPEYEELETEIAKLGSPTAGALDWKKVQELSVKILGEKSKDMMVACYLAASLLQAQNLDGLATGLTILDDLIKTFWEDLSPPKKRMRGRKNAIEWLYARIETFAGDYKGSPVPEEKHKALLAALDEIDSFLAENMEDAPYARSVKDLLNNLPVQSAAAPAAASSDQAATAVPRPATEAAITEISSPADAQKALAAGLKQLKLVANFYLEQDAASPLIYTINRMAAWMPIAALPPESEGATKVPPPPDQVKTVLANLASGTDAMAMLKAAETKVNQFLFWLDLSRWACESLAKLGPQYEAARQALEQATASFVKRLKGIETMAFSDGTPFADPDTRKWLAQISAGEAGAAAPAAPEGSEEAKIAEISQQADQLARDKKLAEAVDLLQNNLGASPAGRSRMLWRLALIRLLVNNKKEQTARSHLDQIISDLDSFKVAEWDPQLAVQGFKAVLGGLLGAKDPESLAKHAHAFDGLARVNPGEALKVEKK